MTPDSFRSIRLQTMAILEGFPIFPLGCAVISRLSTYGILILTAHFLNPEDFGVFSVLLAAIGILSALISGGGDMWLNRFSWQSSSAANQAPRLWPVYLTLVFVLACLVIVVAGLIDFLLAPFEIYENIIFLSILTAAAVGVTEALLAIIRASGTVQLFFVIRDIVTPLTFLAIIFFLHPTSANSLIQINLIFSIFFCFVVALVLFWRAPARLPAVHPPRAAWRPVAMHTGGLIFGNLTSRLAAYLDTLILTAYVPMSVLGEYRVASQFAIGLMVAQHFVFLGLPWQMRLGGEISNNNVALSIVVRRQRLFIMLGCVILAVLWLMTDTLLGFLGQRFIAIADVFRILLLIRFTSLLWGPQHEVLVSRGHGIQDGIANVMSVVVWLSAFLIFVIHISPIKAAIMAGILSTMAAHLYRYTIMNRYKIPPAYGHTFGPALPIAICTGLFWFTVNHLSI